MERLFRPRSIAAIGGSGWCGNIISASQRIGFDGPIWPVNPGKAEIGGLRAFARLADLPSPPDAVFVGVNRDSSISVMTELATMRAGGAVCFAAGFREATAELADGASMQERLVAAAGDMPFLGPNCYGFINALDGAALWPDQHGCERVDRGVAIITQSSNIAINLTMQRRGLPLGYVVTLGNQARLGFAEVGKVLLADPRVTALGLHIEGIGDVPGFEALAATARALGKRIVALKVGASAQAQTATVSHTASLAGSDAGGRALLRRLGIAQVDSLPALLETLKLLHVAGPLASRRIASLSCSGGEASLMADAGLAHGVEFPALNAVQKCALRQALGPKVALSNPLDYNTYVWGDRDAMAACFRAVADPTLAMACVVLDFPRADRCTVGAWDEVVAAMDASLTGSPAPAMPLALIASLPENLPEEVARRCIAMGITPLCGITEAMTAIALAASPLPGKPEPVWPLPPDPAVLPALMTEAQAKAELAAHGLRVPASRRVTSPEEAAAEAPGFPVALKGEGFAHKTEAGAVVLSLNDAEAVRAAARRMGATSFLIEEMVTGGLAEILIGVTRDPAHGWLLTIGSGGVLTELLRDSASALLPVSHDDVIALLRGLKIWPLLQGWRGAPPANLDAIADAVMAVQDYVRTTPGLTEIEINPLICREHDAVAVDALIRRELP